MEGIQILLTAAVAIGIIFLLIAAFSYMYSMRGIKNKTVGDGQHGTARWATQLEIKKTYKHVLFEPEKWRTDASTRPKEQGIVVGCTSTKESTTAILVVSQP